MLFFIRNDRIPDGATGFKRDVQVGVVIGPGNRTRSLCGARGGAPVGIATHRVSPSGLGVTGGKIRGRSAESPRYRRDFTVESGACGSWAISSRDSFSV